MGGGLVPLPLPPMGGGLLGALGGALGGAFNRGLIPLPPRGMPRGTFEGGMYGGGARGGMYGGGHHHGK